MLGASSVSAHAAEIPHYDVSGHCARVARAAGDLGAQMGEACERREHEAHADLELYWPVIPAEARWRCLHIARMAGEHYALLQDCMRLELNILQENVRRTAR